MTRSVQIMTHALPNSFDQVNCVCCFNHTMQLSAKRLLKPFTSLVMANNTEDNGNVSQPITNADTTLTSGDGADFDILNEEIDDDLADNPGDADDDDDEDDDDDDEDNEELLENTAAVQVALDKVC